MKISKNHIMLILLFSFIASFIIMLPSCRAKKLEEVTNNPAIESEVISEPENNNITNDQPEEIPIETAEDIVGNIIKNQINAVLEKERHAYLKTLNPNDDLLQSDNNVWFYYLSQGDIKDFNLDFVEILSEEETKVVASIHLKYTVNENVYDLTYPVKFEKIHSKWYCSGPDYKEMKNDDLRLLYFEEDEAYAKMIMDAAIESYEKVLSNFALQDSEKIVMKFYNNSDWLRQFAYPTSKTKFLAWAAGGGNISLTYSQKAENDEELEYAFRSTLIHEFTHEVSFAIAKYSRFPQWFFEGLAEYYAGPPLHSIESDELRLWTIEELDSDKFYDLTDKIELRSFYYTGATIVKYLVDQYGEEKILELLEGIGDSSLPNEKWMERFTEVFEATYGISYEAFNLEWASSQNL